MSEMMPEHTPPAPQDVRDAMRALSGVMMAAAFVAEPGTWPAFNAYVERMTGTSLKAGPETMAVAIEIVDAVRAGFADAIGIPPGHRYPATEGA